MASKISLDSIVGRLQAQIAFDREREAFHAGQETFHREQRALFAAELEKLTSILESFETAATIATELADRGALPSAAPSLDIGRKPSLTRMVTRILETRPADDIFGSKAITAEVNKHYGEKLRRPVKVNLVSIVLRRMVTTGKLRLVQKGKPRHEALFAKT
jgi:hypothetical protein